MTAGEKLMEHTHRVYELDAILDGLEDTLSALRPTKEQVRRASSLAGIAARLAKEAVTAVDELTEVRS